jgi:GT2 family glycosyltransferase
MKSVSVVIPTYNGKRLLEKNLPPLTRAAAAHNAEVEIIIVDDAGNDGTEKFIRDNYPQIVLLVNDKNYGFGETINRGIFVARNEIVLALNNDILVEEDLFARTLHWFNDPDVFSVTPNIIDPRRGDSQSITKLKPGVCWFRTINLQLNDLPDLTSEIPIFFGSGGASFYSRQKLLQIGGFDQVYRPFYVEDVDLSYRAWKSGWKCLLEPSATVYHETSSTILNMHKKRKIKFIGDRNRTLFLWLNISDPILIARYFLFLPFSLLYDIVSFRKYKFIGFFWALAYLPRVPGLRRNRRNIFRISDHEVIESIRWVRQT